MTGGGRRDRLVWAAWRITGEDGIELSATLEAGEGYERELWSYPGLEEAAEELGPGFREVVRHALSEGHRRGRWRP